MVPSLLFSIYYLRETTEIEQISSVAISEFYTHVEYDAKDIFLHPNFAGGNLYNDIAMIRLDGYVDYSKNPHISPVCLPDRTQEFAGQRCYVTGWGKDSFKGGAYQQVLKEVDVPVISNQR